MRSYFIAALLFVFLLVTSSQVTAHPLGNFSISHYSAIRVGKEAVELRYIIDMAEIPTFQEIQEVGFVPQVGEPSVEAYLMRKSESLSDGLTLEVNGQRLPLRAESREIIFPPGAGGLPTMKIGILYKAKLNGDSKNRDHLLVYRDSNFLDRAGWKEIIAVAAPGAGILNSSVPEADRSSQLNNYPADLLNSPPQVLDAKVAFTTAAIPPSVASTDASQSYVGAAEKGIPATQATDERSDVPQKSSATEPKQPTYTPIIKSGVVNNSDLPRSDTSDGMQLRRQSASDAAQFVYRVDGNEAAGYRDGFNCLCCCCRSRRVSRS